MPLPLYPASRIVLYPPPSCPRTHHCRLSVSSTTVHHTTTASVSPSNHLPFAFDNCCLHHTHNTSSHDHRLTLNCIWSHLIIHIQPPSQSHNVHLRPPLLAPCLPFLPS